MPYRCAPSLRNHLLDSPSSLSLYLFSVRRIKSIFLLAIASGLGFPIVEDFAYIRQDPPGGFSYTVSGILGRGQCAHVSLGLHRPCYAGALLTVQASRGRKDLRLSGLGYLVAGFDSILLAIHPFSQIVTELPIAIPVLNATGSFPDLPSVSDRRAIRTSKINKECVCLHTYAFLLFWTHCFFYSLYKTEDTIVAN